MQKINHIIHRIHPVTAPQGEGEFGGFFLKIKMATYVFVNKTNANIVKMIDAENFDEAKIKLQERFIKLYECCKKKNESFLPDYSDEFQLEFLL